MNHTYMVIRNEDTENPDNYETRILLVNRIEGILPCRLEHMDNKTYFSYEITSRQSLELLCESRKLEKKDLQRILGSILASLAGMEDYLLDLKHLVLEPRFIYLNFESRESALCFVPFYCRDVRESLVCLMENLLTRISLEDRDGVVLGYRLYHELQEKNAQLGDLCRLLQDEILPESSDAKNEKIPAEVQEPDAGPAENTETNKEKGFLRKINTKTVNLLAGGAGAAGLAYAALHFQIPIKADLPEMLGFCAAAAAALGFYFLKRKTKNRKESGEEAIFVKARNCEAGADFFDQDDFFDRDDQDDQEHRGESRLFSEAAGMESDTGATVLLSSAAEEKEMLQAVLVPGRGGNKEIILGKRTVLLGKQADLVDELISSPAVSRLHARIRFSGGQYYLQDLSSSNGTFWNSQELAGEEEVRLSEGDRIAFADAVYHFSMKEARSSVRE